MKDEIGFWSVVAIGIGGMVGGGIFAVLGLAVDLSHGGTPLAFFIAGIVALLTSYSYAKLSVTYPSRGGTIKFLNIAFGTGIITGGLNVLLWLSYIVMLSLYSHAFGSYGASFFPENMQVLFKHILISSVIIFITGLNALNADIIGKAEDYMVFVKLAILLVFVFVGLMSVDIDALRPVTWSPPLQLIAGGMIIFLAYEGFELIANTAEDVKDPKLTLEKAYYAAVGFVIVLYVLISVVVVGNLPIQQIIDAQDYALAAAARPFMGNLGFIMVGIAALLSTSSALNATLYGTARLTYIVAKEGELPKTLTKKVWNKPLEGLLLTSCITLIVSNLFDLSSISMMGSAGFLLIFAAVNIANIKLSEKTHSVGIISLIGFICCVSALGMLIWETIMTTPMNVVVLIIMIVLSFSIELIYRVFSDRKIKLSVHND
jgi:amino acid transporter